MHELSRRISMRHIADESLFIACMNFHTHTYMEHMNEAYYTCDMCVWHESCVSSIAWSVEREKDSHTQWLISHMPFRVWHDSSLTWLIYFFGSVVREKVREQVRFSTTARVIASVYEQARERDRASTRERGSGKACAGERKCVCVVCE